MNNGEGKKGPRPWRYRSATLKYSMPWSGSHLYIQYNIIYYSLNSGKKSPF